MNRLLRQLPINCQTNFRKESVLILLLCGLSVYKIATYQYQRFQKQDLDSVKVYRTTPFYRNYTPVRKKASKFITFGQFHPDQGFGNQIFMFAALFYAAQSTNREVVLFNDHNAQTLEKYFDLNVKKINRTCPCHSFFEEKISYDKLIEREIRSENASASQTILMHGLYQSWKYTQPVQHLIRLHLKFKSDVDAFARNFLRKVIPVGWKEDGFIRVGIHNRRGNFVGEDALKFGLTTAPELYFKKAMKHFADLYKPIQFIVVSQDADWSREHITYSNSSDVNVTYSFKHSPGKDMAILSLCDHVIMSTGTFGWWSAWFANSTTVYYPHYPRNGSFLRDKIDPSDYYLPNWIAME